jgi:hypothetical protein
MNHDVESTTMQYLKNAQYDDVNDDDAHDHDFAQ